MHEYDGRILPVTVGTRGFVVVKCEGYDIARGGEGTGGDRPGESARRRFHKRGVP